MSIVANQSKLLSPTTTAFRRCWLPAAHIPEPEEASQLVDDDARGTSIPISNIRAADIIDFLMSAAILLFFFIHLNYSFLQRGRVYFPYILCVVYVCMMSVCVEIFGDATINNI